MRPHMTVGSIAASALLLAASVGIRAMSQGGPPQTPPPDGNTTGRTSGRRTRRRRGRTARPRQRDVSRAAARAGGSGHRRAGKGLCGTRCRSCHGIDLRGGDRRPECCGPRSRSGDIDGESIMPVVQGSRATQGMDAIGCRPTSRRLPYPQRARAGRGRARAGQPPVVLNVLVGDAAGQQYFAAHCSSCHSITGNLQGSARGSRTRCSCRISGCPADRPAAVVAAAIAAAARPRPAMLRQRILVRSRSRSRCPRVRWSKAASAASTTSSRSRWPTARAASGATATSRSRDRRSARAAKQLLPTYRPDIHNVTAYLATIK